jgi:hypothetical protein
MIGLFFEMCPILKYVDIKRTSLWKPQAIKLLDAHNEITH